MIVLVHGCAAQHLCAVCVVALVPDAPTGRAPTLGPWGRPASPAPHPSAPITAAIAHQQQQRGHYQQQLLQK